MNERILRSEQEEGIMGRAIAPVLETGKIFSPDFSSPPPIFHIHHSQPFLPKNSICIALGKKIRVSYFFRRGKNDC